MSKYLIVYAEINEDLTVVFNNKTVDVPKLTSDYIKKFEEKESVKSDQHIYGFDVKVINIIPLEV